MSGKAKPGARRATTNRAPAAKKAAKRSPGVERRQAKRLDVLWQLNVEVLSHPMPVSVSDISATGFSVETTTPFQEGEVHEFRFSLDGGSSAVLQAEAAHGVANDRVGELQLYLTGFKFVELDAAQKLALKTLLGQIQQYLALA
jgi:c-di-GMP-binding flagellar brake protein YcgR